MAGLDHRNLWGATLDSRTRTLGRCDTQPVMTRDMFGACLGRKRLGCASRDEHLSNMAHSPLPNCQGPEPLWVNAPIAPRLLRMSHCEYVLRVGTPSGAQAITARMPTLPLDHPPSGCIEPGRAEVEPAPRRTTQCLVFRGPVRLPNALPQMPLPDGSPPAHRVRPIAAGTPQRAALQRVRRANDGRTARGAPVLRCGGGCRLAFFAVTITAPACRGRHCVARRRRSAAPGSSGGRTGRRDARAVRQNAGCRIFCGS